MTRTPKVSVTGQSAETIRLWFEADGQPWLALGLTPNQWGQVRCKNLLAGRKGWFPRTAAVQGGRPVARVTRRGDDRGPAFVPLPAGEGPVRLDGTPVIEGPRGVGTIVAGDAESVRREYARIVSGRPGREVFV